MSLQWNWVTGFFIVVLLYFHEAGHVAAALWRGIDIQRPPLFIPGFGALVLVGESSGIWDEVMLALGGPVVGSIAALGAQFLGTLLQVPGLAFAGFFALILSLLNMAPFIPLDGGRVVALTGWIGLLPTLILGVASLSLLSRIDPAFALIVGFGMIHALRSADSASAPGKGTRWAVSGLYALVVALMVLALIVGGRVELPEPGIFPWLTRGGKALTIGVAVWLSSLIVTPYIARQRWEARIRTIGVALFGWPQYLLSAPWRIPIMFALAAHALGAPLAWLKHVIRFLARRSILEAGAGVGLGYDFLVRRTETAGPTWLDEMTPILQGGSPALLNVAYGFLVAMGYGAIAHHWLVRAMAGREEQARTDHILANNLAWALLQVGRADEAVPLARSAVAARLREPSFLDTLGQVLLAAGRPEEAVTYLRDSYARRKLLTTRLALARALAASGSTDEAVAEAERALSDFSAKWPADGPSRETVDAWARAWRSQVVSRR